LVGIGLAAAGLVFALIVAEAALRVGWKNPYRREAPDLSLRLRLHHPGADHTLDRSLINPEQPRVRFRTDDRGYIVPSRRFPKPDYTLLFLGGSVTECIAVAETLRFPAQVSFLLEQRGLKVNTLNAGHSGNTIHDALNILLNYALTDSPDVAILMHVHNDLGVLRRDPAYRTRMALPVSLNDAARYLLQEASHASYLVACLRKFATQRQGIKPDPRGYQRDYTVEPGQFRSRLEIFIHICRAFGIIPVLMTEPVASFRTDLTPGWIDQTAHSQFNDLIREVCAAGGVNLIDLESYVRAIPGYDRPNELFYDGVHLTDKGSQLYAKFIAAMLADTVLTPK